MKQAESPACTKNRILIVAEAFNVCFACPLSPLAIEKELPINIRGGGAGGGGQGGRIPPQSTDWGGLAPPYPKMATAT